MTVTLLAVGLIVAGFGTAIFLRNALIASVDKQVEQLAPTDLASSVFEITTTTAGVTFDEKDDVASTTYFVAIYGPEGTLRASAGGAGAPEPAFPSEITLQSVAVTGTTPFTVQSTAGGSVYRASVDTYQVPGVSDLFTQLIALPLAPVNQVVAQYIGIYTILAVVILIGSAFATRWLVTLTFRSLGQVESTAMEIATGDFSQRMTDIEPTSTEVGRLKTAINAMLGRVDFAISQRDASAVSSAMPVTSCAPRW